MFTLFSLYWATDVYLLWAEVYLILPLKEQTQSSIEAVYWNGVQSGTRSDNSAVRSLIPPVVQHVVLLHRVLQMQSVRPLVHTPCAELIEPLSGRSGRYHISLACVCHSGTPFLALRTPSRYCCDRELSVVLPWLVRV